ncbi:MAG: hypothetical protein AAB473_02480 [Patescibacteria group bacterium]
MTLLLACSDVQLSSVPGEKPEAGLSYDDPCRYPVSAGDGSVVELVNEATLASIDLESTDLYPDQHTEIANFVISVIHPECPPLTVFSAAVAILGGDEAAVGWPTSNLLEEGGVTLRIGTSEVPVANNVSLEVNHGEGSDEFEWEGDGEIGVLISGGESAELALTVNTAGAGTGEYPDMLLGRFGWLWYSDGSSHVLSGENYYGPIVEVW